MRVRIAFEPRDAWIGVYWNWRKEKRVYVCLVPFFPLVIEEKP